MKAKSTLRSLLALAGGSLIAISSASAADGSWSVTGGGDWSTTTNWISGTVADGVDFTATFGNVITANSIINLDVSRTIGNITASDTAQNYTISGANILTLDLTTGIPVIDVTTSGRTLTISSQISGADGLQKSGAGTLTLSGTNDYTGGTTINAGRLSISDDANLGHASGGITLNGGELHVSGGGKSTSRAVTLNAITGNSIALQGNAGWTFAGAFTGDGGVNFVQVPNGNVSAALTSTSNTFKGALGITSGGNNITVSIASLADSATANGNIIFSDGSGAQTLQLNEAAATSLTLNYRSIEFLGNSNRTYSIYIPNFTTNDRGITINTDLVYAGSGTKTLSFQIDNANSPGITFSGVISNGTGGGTVAITKTNNGGPLALLGNNSYTGQTQLLSGTTTVNTLADFGSNSSIGRGTSGVALVLGISGSTGTLNYTGGTTSTNRTIQINSSSTSSGGATIANNGTGKLTFTAATFNQTFSGTSVATRTLTLRGSNDGEIQGIIQDSNATTVNGLTKTDAGTWTLSGANTYTGATTVQQGNLVAGSNSAFGNAASEVVLGVAGGNNDAGILTGGAYTVGRDIRIATNNTTDTGTRVLTLGGNTAANSEFSGNIFLGTNSQAGRGVTLTAASGGQVTFSGVIQNPTSMDATTYTVTKSGQGTVVLTNANTYTGGTTVSAGKLLVNNATGSGTGTGTVTVGASGTLGGTGAISGAVNVTGQLSPGASIETLATGNLSLFDTSTLIHELDSSVATSVGSDLLVVTGNLSLTGTVNLSLADLALTDVAFAVNDTFSLINYTGTWNGGLFTLSGNELSDEEVFSFGLNTWMISYNDATGGLNYLGEYAGGTDSFVNITAVSVIPEPSTALLGGLGVLLLFRRRR